jgi:thiol-disulfide isomerase/thioredoxin
MVRSYRNKSRQNRSSQRKEGRSGGNGEERATLLPLVVIAVIVLVLGGALYLYISSQGSDGDDTSDENGDDGQGPGEQTDPLYISLENIDGGSMRMVDLNGRVIVLDLMATWCGPCKVQMEELRQLRDAVSPVQVEIVSVGVDLSESAALLRSFKAEEEAQWPFLMSNQDFNDAFPARSIPTLYILDRSGGVAKTHVGVTDSEVLRTEVTFLLA